MGMVVKAWHGVTLNTSLFPVHGQLVANVVISQAATKHIFSSFFWEKKK